jgi:LysR family transcriptional regulator (chromosome initiation inhibitor)
MLSPARLATFAAVCECGSFELAAARVGVTPSAVIQRTCALAEAARCPSVWRPRGRRRSDGGSCGTCGRSRPWRRR